MQQEHFISYLSHLGEFPLIINPKEEIVSNLYNIDIEKVINAKGLPDFVKKVAIELTYKRYFTTGYYFSTLSNNEILMLHKVVEAVETKDTGSVIFTQVEQQQMYKDLLLMGMLLSLAAGKPTLNSEEIMQMRQSLTNFILTEFVHRFRKTHMLMRSNYDLFEHNKVIAIAIKKGDNPDGKSKTNS